MCQSCQNCSFTFTPLRKNSERKVFNIILKALRFTNVLSGTSPPRHLVPYLFPTSSRKNTSHRQVIHNF